MKHPDDPDKVLCCPREECESARLWDYRGDRMDHEYRCRECDHRFDEPAERKRKTGGAHPGCGFDWYEDVDYEFEWDRDPQTQGVGGRDA